MPSPLAEARDPDRGAGAGAPTRDTTPPARADAEPDLPHFRGRTSFGARPASSRSRAGEGLLSPEGQQQRIDPFDFDVPVYLPDGSDGAQSPARAYGFGLANGWYGHTGELPGYNTVVQHHPETGTTLIVMVDSDIKSGECPDGSPITNGGRTTGPCSDPAVYLGDALAEAIGLPLT